MAPQKKNKVLQDCALRTCKIVSAQKNGRIKVKFDSHSDPRTCPQFRDLISRKKMKKIFHFFSRKKFKKFFSLKLYIFLPIFNPF